MTLCGYSLQELPQSVFIVVVKSRRTTIMYNIPMSDDSCGS